MAPVAARQPLRPFHPAYIAKGPFRHETEPTLGHGHVELPQWNSLQIVDKKQWEYSGFQSQFVFGRGPEDASIASTSWVPPSQRPFVPLSQRWEVEEPRALKQRHLYGNVGVITNPQPSTTNSTDFLVQKPTWGHYAEEEPGTQRLATKPTLRDRKLLEQSSEIFDRKRNRVPSTLSPREDIFENSYGNFPYCDSTLDERVPKSPHKKPTALAVDEPTPGPTPRVCGKPQLKFEPPSRPGAAFRRRREKNFSELFDYDMPPASSRQRSEVNVVAGIDFRDTRIEVAHRSSGNRFPMRMRSAPELPGTEGVRAATASANGSGSNIPAAAAGDEISRRKGALPAGAGGSSGGDSEVRLAVQEERRLAAAAKENDGKIWEAMRKNNKPSLWSDEALSPLSHARKRMVTDHGTRVFGEAPKTDWDAVHNPRVHIPGMDIEIPPRFPRSLENAPGSPGCSSPRSPRSPRSRGFFGGGSPRERCNTGFFSRDMGEDAIQDTEALPCKAASRSHYQRHMSSDPTDLFGAYLKQPCHKIGACHDPFMDKVNSPRGIKLR